MGIKVKIEEKATKLTTDLSTQAEMKYIKWLMKEEDIDYDEAVAIVQGLTDPLEPEYMLGFKLANPVLMIALFKQPGKKNRLAAARNFAATLSEEEKEIFWNEVFDEENAKQFKKKYKAEKKNKGLSTDDDD